VYVLPPPMTATLMPIRTETPSRDLTDCL
jgi:hypothetical protein